LIAGKSYKHQIVGFFDYPGDNPSTDIHPNVKKIMSKTHFANAVQYLAKEDPANEDLKVPIKTNRVDAVWESKTLQDALRFANVSEANNIITLWNNKPKNFAEEPTYRLRRWQQNFSIELLAYPEDKDDEEASQIARGLDISEDDGSEIVFVDPSKKDGRKITIVYDPAGGNGKNTFSKFLCNKFPHRFYHIQGLGQIKDMMEVIKNALSSGWSGETLFINIAKQCADHKIYESLECFIDGTGTSQKYSGSSISWKARRVVVFTNFMLDLHKMTWDRWDIRKINDKTKLFEPILYYKGLQIYAQERSSRSGSKNADLYDIAKKL